MAVLFLALSACNAAMKHTSDGPLGVLDPTDFYRWRASVVLGTMCGFVEAALRYHSHRSHADFWARFYTTPVSQRVGEMAKTRRRLQWPQIMLLISFLIACYILRTPPLLGSLIALVIISLGSIADGELRGIMLQMKSEQSRGSGAP
jgi:hypothetical protein